MADEPTPDPSPKPKEGETPALYRPRASVFLLAFLLMSLLHYFFPRTLPPETTFVSLLVNDAFASLVVLGMFSAYLRVVRKLTWAAAVAYSSMLIGGMFAADIVRAVLLFR